MIKNIGFRLNYTYDGDAHVKCPHCFQAYDVEWDTEYGEPSMGEHEATCPNCDKTWDFEVYTKYSQ